MHALTAMHARAWHAGAADVGGCVAFMELLLDAPQQRVREAAERAREDAACVAVAHAQVRMMAAWLGMCVVVNVPCVHTVAQPQPAW